MRVFQGRQVGSRGVVWESDGDVMQCERWFFDKNAATAFWRMMLLLFYFGVIMDYWDEGVGFHSSGDDSSESIRKYVVTWYVKIEGDGNGC